MGTEVTATSMDNLQVMAQTVAASRLWKTVDTKEKAMALMLLCQAEGLHPMTAVRRYDLIQGTPTMKAEAQLAEFYSRGGVVKWISRTAEACEAKFSHPKHCPDGVVIRWDLDMARKAKLAGKENWINYPRQMLSARVISEGVQTVDPGAGLGMLTPEEAIDVRNHQMDAAADISANLTGEERKEVTAAPMPEREDKEWRDLRAELNKSLQACKSTKEFREVCLKFQQLHTPAIWVERTRHRHSDVETFAMLAQQHQERLTSEEHFVSPEGMKEWREKLAVCSESEFHQFEETMLAYPAYKDSQECHDALAQRGRELGIEEYALGD
jgi:hypothetical protein